MFAHRVVEALDVFEPVGSGFFPFSVDLAAEPFGLHRRERALHRGVVPAFTAMALAAGDLALDVIDMGELSQDGIAGRLRR